MDPRVSISLIYIITFPLFIKPMQYIKSITIHVQCTLLGFKKRTTCASKSEVFIRFGYVYFFIPKEKK